MENGIIINGKEYELVEGTKEINDCDYCDLFKLCMDRCTLCIDVFDEPSNHFKLKTK